MTGRTPSTHIDQFWGKDYLFITPTELHQSYHINYSEKKISETGMREIGLKKIGNISILVGCIGWDMGNVGVVNKKCAFNQQINAITNFSESYNPYFIYYLLSGKKELFRRIAGVTRTPILKKSDFENIELIVPDRTMQDRIATLLKQFDDKIALNNHVNATLEAMAKRLYDYWFVQFDFPDEKGRPYKTSGGKMVYNEELGREIPAGWEVKRIGDLLKKVSTPKGLQTSEYKKDGVLPIVDQSQQFIVGYTDCIESECLPKESEVIVFGDHTCFFKYVNFSFALGADGTQCIISRDLSRMPQLLLYYSIKDIPLANKGYARHFKFLKDTSILVPDSRIAQSFQHLTQALYSTIRKNIEETHRLAALRDWLLPILMNGQVGFRNTVLLK